VGQEGVPGIADVKLSTDGNQFVVVGQKPGTTTLLLIKKDGTQVNYNINVFARSPDAVEREVAQLLEGTTGKQSSLVPGRAALRWMRVTSSGRGGDAEQIASRLRINPEFTGKLYDTIKPGTTVIITDQPVVRNRGKAAILES
jgi:hypothetical protein